MSEHSTPAPLTDEAEAALRDWITFKAADVPRNREFEDWYEDEPGVVNVASLLATLDREREARALDVEALDIAERQALDIVHPFDHPRIHRVFQDLRAALPASPPRAEKKEV